MVGISGFIDQQRLPLANTFAQRFRVVSHPAFRIGFLDAQNGRPFDHDDIFARIEAETPPRALDRIGWVSLAFDPIAVNLAQFRYEEGRLAYLDKGWRCKGWNNPDFPPARAMAYCEGATS